MENVIAKYDLTCFLRGSIFVTDNNNSWVEESESIPLWVPSPDQANITDTPEWYACQFLNRFERVFEGVARQRCHGATIALALLDHPSLNARVCARSEQAATFAACINRGSFELLHGMFHADLFRLTLADALPTLASVDPTAIARYAMYPALSWLAWHELAHVLRGHMGFLAKPLSATSIIEIMEARSDYNLDLRQTANRRLCENDADSYGGRFVAPLIAQQIQEIALIYPEVNSVALSKDLVCLTGCAIYCLFSLFEQQSQRQSPDYEIPLIRCGIVSTQFSIGLGSYIDRFDMNSLLRGFELGKVACGLLGHNQAQVDSALAFMEWQRDRVPALKKLAKKLRKFRIYNIPLSRRVTSKIKGRFFT